MLIFTLDGDFALQLATPPKRGWHYT